MDKGFQACCLHSATYRRNSLLIEPLGENRKNLERAVESTIPPVILLCGTSNKYQIMTEWREGNYCIYVSYLVKNELLADSFTFLNSFWSQNCPHGRLTKITLPTARLVYTLFASHYAHTFDIESISDGQ
jgi:hypothetical protein